LLLKVQGISKRFGVNLMLHNASFSVKEGEVVGLIGPNGAGKTTLFECLAGLLPSNGGQVIFRDQALAPAHRKDALFICPTACAPGPINQCNDQCAGILFNLKPNGDYLTVRFNGKEDNLVVLWTFSKGKRSFVKRGSETCRSR